MLAIVFGFLWIRDVTRPVRRLRSRVEPERRRRTCAITPAEDEGPETYPRSTFLAAATLGLGAVIGGLVTLPVLGFAVLPSFSNQEDQDVELGPIDDFPEGEFVIATFLENPDVGEVSRRTTFVRYNGARGQPSFTMLYSRCAHLGCPVQPNGPDRRGRAEEPSENVDADPDARTGFSCPCHGGAYDTEGNRTAGPPVRALDRFEFSIIDGNLVLGSSSASARSRAPAPRARIYKYGRQVPGRPRRRHSSVALPDRAARNSREGDPKPAARAVALYPLDWLEERSGLVGGVKYFLFRKVPRDTTGSTRSARRR